MTDVALERLDLRSARFDRLSGSVLINGRENVVEISIDALERLCHRSVASEEAVLVAVSEAKRITVLASRLPADDGKINITAGFVENDEAMAVENGS